MPSTFRDIKSALATVTKQLQKAVDASLLEEVTNAVKVAEVNSVVDYVYSRPTSGAYHRRYASGGLGSVENLHERLDGSGVLVVTNDTPFNPFLNGRDENKGISANSGNGLAGLVNYGDGWNGYEYDYSSKGATNFIQNTVGDLAASGDHVKALKSGLIKQGFDVK